MSARSKFYRDTRNGKFMGVCAGLSDYLGIDVLWIRVITVALILLGLPFVFIIYLVIGFIAPVKPLELYNETATEREFWREVRTQPRTTVNRVRSRIRDLERRLRTLEAYATSSTVRLNREIDKLRDT